MNKKRGQVTVFIIIGIAIVLIAFLLFSFRVQIADFFEGIGSPEKQPVQKYVEECLDITSEAAITIIGLQGGYLELPLDLEYSDPLNPGYVPPPPSAARVPMWWYEGKDYIPTLDRMEGELERSIDLDLEQCLENFEVFEGQYDIEIEGEREINVEINKESVDIEMKYPLKLTQNDATEIRLDLFTTSRETRLGTMHEFATSIMNYENENAFLEDLTMDMIAVADGGNNSPHLPLEGWSISCAENQWSTQLDLIPDLQNIVKYNLHFLNFDNSKKDYIGEDNPRIDLEYCDETDEDLGLCTETRTAQGRRLDYYDSFYTLDTSSKNYPDIKVKTVYDKSFGMSMQVEPSDGDIVKAFNLPLPVVGSCINIYHHRYDIQYPVMFTLTDDTGYTFNFATPVVIENNEPKRYTEPLTGGDYTYSPSSTDYCAQRIHQRDVFTVDKTTNEHIQGVDLRYECVQFACDLGKTDYPLFQGIRQTQSNPFLSTAFPPCINGFLIASKEGYKGASIQLTVDANPSSIQPIEMTPTSKVNISVLVAEFDNGQFNLRSLEEDETLFVSIDNQEENHQSTSFLPSREEYPNELEFIDDNIDYTLDIKLMKAGQPIGGLLLEEWSVVKGQLSTSNNLRVYAITTPIPPASQEEFLSVWQNIVLEESADFPPSFR